MIGLMIMLWHILKKELIKLERDVEFGREWVINNAITRSDQEAVLNAVKFKTEVLWAQLDALYYSYVDPGNIPPGAFIPYKKEKEYLIMIKNYSN